MKIIVILTCFFLFIINTSCRKDKPIINYSNSSSFVSVTQTNSAPVANAGEKEITYFIYKDTSYNIQLKGSATDKENNIQSYYWKKISGPSSFVIENKDSLQTNIHQLIIGEYEFELTVTDTKGLSGKDTTKIIIEKDLFITHDFQNKIIINNLEWLYAPNEVVEIKNLIFLISLDTGFKIFIERDNNGKWIEVNQDYNWDIYDPSI